MSRLMRQCRGAVLQHQRTRRCGQALLHTAPGTSRSERDTAARRPRTVFRAARTPSDREDIHPAGAEGRAEPKRQLPLRLHQRGGRPSGARGRRCSDAVDPQPHGAACPIHPERRLRGEHLAGDAGACGAVQRLRGSPGPMGGSGRAATRAADRRDRRADRRHAPVRAATVARGIRPASLRLSAERRPVRCQRRARLPHPFLHRGVHRHRRQRLQHQVRVPAAGGFLAAGSAGSAHPAHPGDGTGVRPRMPSRRSGRSPRASRGW